MSFQIPVGAKVALREEVAGLYSFASGGSEGVIRSRKLDDDGFPLVYIEWDDAHWRFKGQKNGWTFEQHFKIVEPPNDAVDKLDKVEDEYTETDFEFESVDRRGGLASGPDERMEEYIEALASAVDAASEAQAFMTVVIKSVPDPDNPGYNMLIPEIHGQAMSERASLLLDAQVNQVAAVCHANLVLELLRTIGPEEDKNAGM